MAKVLVTFTDRLGDVEISGFKIMTDVECDSYEELITNITWPFSIKLNKGELEYSDGNDLLSRLDFTDLSFDENKILKRIFNNNFGYFITEKQLQTILDGSEDDYLESRYVDDYDVDNYYNNDDYNNYIDYDDDYDEY